MDQKSSYEFSQEQNASLEALATYMGTVGAVLLLLCTFYLLYIFYAGYNLFEVLKSFGNLPSLVYVILAGQFIAIAIFLAQAVLMRKAARGFQMITKTAGNDVEHLMTALNSLKTLYAGYYIIVVSGIVFLAGMILLHSL